MKEKKAKKVLEKKKVKLGRPSTVENIVRTSLSLSSKELKELKEQATEKGCKSVSDYVRSLIRK